MNAKQSFVVLMLLTGAAWFGSARYSSAADEKLTGSRIVVLTQMGDENPKPVIIKQDEVVRIDGEGIAGSTVTAKVTGPARAVKNQVKRYSDGYPSIGTAGVEFEVKSTGKGKVTVEVTVTFPIPNTPNTVTKYEYTVN